MDTRCPIFLDLVQNALLNSLWRHQALQRFLHRCGISDSALAHLTKETTKRQFLDWLIPQIERDPRRDEVLCTIANKLATQETFPDLEQWPDTPEKKQAAIEARDALRSHLEREKRREADEADRARRRRAAETVSHESSLRSLRQELDSLATRLGEQGAGYDFQDWFGRLAHLFEADYKKPYRSGGREYDGSLTIDGITYLLSLKFTVKQAQPADIADFQERVHDKADLTLGLFISMAGYTSIAIEKASRAETKILLIDHSHLYLVLSGGMTLGELIARIRGHASRTGLVFLPIGDFSST